MNVKGGNDILSTIVFEQDTSTQHRLYTGAVERDRMSESDLLTVTTGINETFVDLYDVSTMLNVQLLSSRHIYRYNQLKIKRKKQFSRGTKTGITSVGM